MAKVRRIYTCQSCGHREAKWLGRCPECEQWSTLVEELISSGAQKRVKAERNEAVPIVDVECSVEARFGTGIAELDQVLGGGLVVGSLVLVGGDPGIGKSTLLLQAMGKLAQAGRRVLYATGEESAAQVKLRAERLDALEPRLFLLAETSLESIDSACAKVKADICVIDSIQTVALEELESPVGSVSQIRAVTHHLMQWAKKRDVSIFVVGHVTKEGSIAGPKVMEHMVDTVLYFEGEKTGPYRLLRAHKNRFGSAQEVGVFEMRPDGLCAVANPSELFLSQRIKAPGSAVISSIEGSRPLLLEVQALATPTFYPSPKRTTVGFDPQRVSMLCAVLSARAGFELGGLDIYINMAGGVRVSEPAADLGVLIALASSITGQSIDDDIVVMGEVGLSGEIRGVSRLEARIQEAAALGFKRCIIPKNDHDQLRDASSLCELLGVSDLKSALDVAGVGDTYTKRVT
jgi:DNA repair protein RadA/Sms